MTETPGSNWFTHRPSIPALADCHFYHTIDIPGHGVMRGDWDLRPNIARYLGQVNAQGKRVLDVGTANGFLTFHLERQGATVVSYDLSPRFAFDIAPSRYGYSRHARDHRAYIAAVNNGYWLAHHAFNSQASMVHGTVYQIRKEIGPVDIAIFGSILLHLRDPFLALQNALRLTTERVVVVEPMWQAHSRRMTDLIARIAGPYMVFTPEYWRDTPQGTWWFLSPAIVTKFVAALGFEKTTISYHEQSYRGKKHRLFTIVAERTQPIDDFGLDTPLE